MVYRPDGSGRDMYVLGPRSAKGPQIVDVAARASRGANKDANASLGRSDNNIPNKMPDYELRALVTRKINERAQSAAADASLSAARLAMMASGAGDSIATTTHSNGASTHQGTNTTMMTRGLTPLSATVLGSGSSAANIPVLSTIITPTRYNSGLTSGGNSPATAVVLASSRGGAPNEPFSKCQRAPSTYVSPKAPSTPQNVAGRVPINSLGATKSNFASTNAWHAASASSPFSNGGSMGASGSTNLAGSVSSPPSTPSSHRPTSSAGGGFVYSRHIYESSSERALRTGLSFQPYEAPMARAVFPEIRARYANM